MLQTEAQNRFHTLEFLRYADLKMDEIKLPRAIADAATTIKANKTSPGFEACHDAMEAGFPTRQVRALSLPRVALSQPSPTHTWFLVPMSRSSIPAGL